MQLGNEYLDLTEYLAPRGRPIPTDSRSNDLWFQHIAIVVRDMDQAFEKLRALKVQFVSTGPQTLPPSIAAAAGIKAFYFRDPDEHNLELIYFPPGKGDPRWQETTNKLFLGIDHTAIGISNSESSLKFYRDLLGFRKAGESENFGTEQEHLNQVFGAHLQITGMRAASGPGTEFLEYLPPRDGRARPADVHANDIVHWQTALDVFFSKDFVQYLDQRALAHTQTETGAALWNREHLSVAGGVDAGNGAIVGAEKPGSAPPATIAA